MKATHLTALSLLSLLIATPALAQMKASKSDNGVNLECAITGSDDTGWSIYGTNTEAKKKSCNVKCELTMKKGGTHPVEAKGRPLRESQTRSELSGEVPFKLGGFKAAKITEAACKNIP